MSDISNVGQPGIAVAQRAAGLVKKSLPTVSRWGTGVALIGGVISDILNPLAPFAAYIFFLAATASVALLLAILVRRTLAARATPALMFSVMVTSFSGAIYAVQTQTGDDRGAIASLVPAIAKLQNQIGLVTDKVERIELTVDKTLQAVEQVQQQTSQVQQTTQDLAVSIGTIAEGFKTLSVQRGVIADPQRPDQFYHNARVYELGGDMLNARRAYLAFAAFDLDSIDPHVRLANLVRVQDGVSGAREVFGALAAKSSALAPKLVYILQSADAQRLAKLDEFIATNPAYAPAYYFRSLEFSEDRLGTQTLDDRRNEAAALTAFLEQEKDGGLLKYFIDHAVLGEWLGTARRRMAALGDVVDPSLGKPSLVTMRSNAGWNVTVMLPEAATGLSWKVGSEKSFTEAGVRGFKDPTTGKPMLNDSFVLPGDQPATSIFIKYRDARGRDVGPFEIAFNPSSALADEHKEILEQLWTAWLDFRTFNNRNLMYFSHIVSYRCAIEEVRYGFNNDSLSETLGMPPCDEEDPVGIPNGADTYLELGDDVRSIRIQISYLDGTESPIRTFKR